MEQQTFVYLAITVLSVIFAIGGFVGITKMSFESIKNSLETLGKQNLALEKQIKELRDDNKAIAELSTRMSLVEKGIEHLEKCQEHLNTDMTIFKKRNVKKVEE